MVHHRDDFLAAIAKDRAGPLDGAMQAMFKIEFAKRIGNGNEQAAEFLHHRIGWREEGCMWGPNAQYVRDLAGCVEERLDEKERRRVRRRPRRGEVRRCYPGALRLL